MQNIPSSFAPLQPTPVQRKDRGGLFTVVLVLNSIAAVAGTIAVVIGGAALNRATADGSMHEIHHITSRLIAALTVFQLAQLACVGGIWAWKRWALYGYFTTAALAVFGAIKVTGEIPYWSLFGIGLMLLCVFPRLRMFED